MKMIRWMMGTVMLGVVLALIILRPFPILFYPDLPYVGFYTRGLYILILAGCLCLYRIAKGPTGADRIVGLDIFGIMIVGMCALLTITTERSWYLDIGIAWTLQSFISTLALSKFLEGKGFDE